MFEIINSYSKENNRADGNGLVCYFQVSLSNLTEMIVCFYNMIDVEAFVYVVLTNAFEFSFKCAKM